MSGTEDAAAEQARTRRPDFGTADRKVATESTRAGLDNDVELAVRKAVEEPFPMSPADLVDDPVRRKMTDGELEWALAHGLDDSSAPRLAFRLPQDAGHGHGPSSRILVETHTFVGTSSLTRIELGSHPISA